MRNLDIFLKFNDWHKLIETMSRLLLLPGSEEKDDFGVRHVWHLFGLDVVAIDGPDLEDDQGIPFSTFSAQVSLVLHRTANLPEEETFRYAFAVLLVLRLRSFLDPDACLVRNLQNEIEI